MSIPRPPSTAQTFTTASGGIVVFSSLSPHLTGPNTSDAVRKAYILQYAPDGAVVHTDDGQVIVQDGGESLRRSLMMPDFVPPREREDGPWGWR